MTTYSVQYCHCGDTAEHQQNYAPVALGIQNRTDAGRVAGAFEALHQGLLWAVVEHDENGNGFKIVDYVRHYSKSA